MTDPIRLLADPTAPAELRADLTALREQTVSFDLEASLASFEARLASGDLTTDADEVELPEAESPPGPEPSGLVPRLGPSEVGAGHGAGSLTAGKVLAILALGAGAGFGALQLIESNTVTASGSSSPLPVARPEIPEVPGVPSPTPLAPAPRDAGPTEDGTSTTTREPRRPTKHLKAVAPPAEEAEPSARELPPEPTTALAAPPPPVPVEEDAPPNALQREIAQLGEIRKTLASDPRRALDLANRGHVEFRAGSLYQEREALALRALRALGDQDALESRGRAFLLRYPKSSFANEVERMLAE